MAACRSLAEYARLVEAVRGRDPKTKEELAAAVDAAVDEMPQNFEIREYIVKHRAEVEGMFLTEYSQAREMEKVRNETLDDLSSACGRIGVAVDTGAHVEFSSLTVLLAEANYQQLSEIAYAFKSCPAMS